MRGSLTGWLTVLMLLVASSTGATDYSGNKILWVNSYHRGYAWSDGVGQGIELGLSGTGAQLRTIYLDTKRKRDQAFMVKAGEQARDFIERFQPDVVITSDDNAAKYLIQAHYLDKSLPFVFCGINLDPSVYGFPSANVTGMQEVELIELLIEQLRKYSKGPRLGYIHLDDKTSRKVFERFERTLGLKFDQVYVVNSFEGWKRAYLLLQDEVDMAILTNHVGLSDWDDEQAQQFALENIQIPTGAFEDWAMPYTLLGYAKIAEEHGTWAAQAALKILDGASPADIPITRNKRGQLLLNIDLVKKLGLMIDRALYKRATIYP
jgi:hypothetical protein